MGSAQAGPKVAAILSVVESCRRLGVPVKDYLAAVLPRRTLSEAANLTPARLVRRWNAAKGRFRAWHGEHAARPKYTDDKQSDHK